MTDETGWMVYIPQGMRADNLASRPTGHLRWVRPPGTTTQPDRLQQLWQHEGLSGPIRHEWLDVPVEIVAPPPPTPKEKA